MSISLMTAAGNGTKKLSMDAKTFVAQIRKNEHQMQIVKKAALKGFQTETEIRLISKIRGNQCNFILLLW